MLLSLRQQVLKPDLLLLNISSEPYLFDEGITTVPDWLNDGFATINFVENTGPYRKLLPVIREIDDDDLLICADDDVLYGDRWLKSLVELAHKYSGHIIAARARRMKKNILGKWQNYVNWDYITNIEEGIQILPIGCGGIVYRKALLDFDFLFDPVAQKISPTTDDLWYKMASMRYNVPVLACPNIDLESIYLEHKKGLIKVNWSLRREKYIQRVFKSTIGEIGNWLGISDSENDRAWIRIVNYSR